jgi:outer membrane protein assembly factor BamB
MDMIRRFSFFKRLIALFFALIALLPLVGQSQEWPQWRGPNRDDVSLETGLLDQWPEGGPRQVWHSEAGGLGYSGFSIAGGRLFTMGGDSESEFVLCMDAATGKEIWRTPIDKLFVNNWGDGPRSTPTISGDHVYALASAGTVACLAVADGKLKWKQNLTEFGGKVPSWGYSESVLVDGDKVVCTPGGPKGALLALDAKTGEKIWQSTLYTELAHYSSIIIADHPKKRHYVQLTDKAFVGIDPENGMVLWRHKWDGTVAIIPTPIYTDQKVYVTSGYGAGCTLVDISDLENPKEVWFNKKMKNHHGGVILVNGHYYGFSDGVGWLCQGGEDGNVVWNEKNELGKGTIAYADGRFYIVDERTGDVALIEANTEEWVEKGRFTLAPQSEQRKSEGRIWVHPVVAGGKLYLRDQEMIWCFDVSKN